MQIFRGPRDRMRDKSFRESGGNFFKVEIL